MPSVGKPAASQAASLIVRITIKRAPNERL